MRLLDALALNDAVLRHLCRQSSVAGRPSIFSVGVRVGFGVLVHSVGRVSDSRLLYLTHLTSPGQSSAHSLVERTSERMATGILTSSPSTSITERGGSMTGRSPAGIALRYDRTTTLGKCNHVGHIMTCDAFEECRRPRSQASFAPCTAFMRQGTFRSLSRRSAICSLRLQ